MRTWTVAKRLQHFVDEAGSPRVVAEPAFRGAEKRIYDLLRTQGERATKGRKVGAPRFSAAARSDGVVLRMEMDGRHASGVAWQVARRLQEELLVQVADVVRTPHGAVLVVRLVPQVNPGSGA